MSLYIIIIVLFISFVIYFGNKITNNQVNTKSLHFKQQLERMGIYENEIKESSEFYEKYYLKLMYFGKLTNALVMVVLFFVGTLILYIWKTTQTSDLALQYSRAAHNEMGEYVFIMLITLLIAGALSVPTFLLRKSFIVSKNNLYDKLNELYIKAKNNSDTRVEVEIERKLRKLESGNNNAFSEWKNRIE